MRTSIVFTLTGPDRVGIVEDVTRVMLSLGANVETSRMARLGGEFAILMLATMPARNLGDIDAAFAPLRAAGYQVTTSRTGSSADSETAARMYRIDLEGADHEGIVHEIAAGLSALGINIEAMETGVRSGAMSGAPLFFMTAIVAVPHEVAETDWMTAITEAGENADVDLKITLADET